MLAAQRLLIELSAPIATRQGPVLVRPPLGLALGPDHAESSEALLRFAETARTHARAKPERYCVYNPAMTRTFLKERRLEAQLCEALEQNAFHLAYQPQVEVASGTVRGIAALFRWELPVGQAPDPGTVFAIAERSGLRGRLSAWVLNTALRECSELRRVGNALSISVNLTALDIQDPETPHLVEQTLKTWDVPATDLLIEITESSMIQDLGRCMETLARFRELGVRISIDDFGTGFSSLSYLQRLPVDELKVDQSFLRGMRHHERDDRIVQAIIHLGHLFGLRVVAEGVEDAETADALARYGCDLMQGSHISPPREKQAFVTWWESRAKT